MIELQNIKTLVGLLNILYLAPPHVADWGTLSRYRG